ncbi:MAG: GH116 family glycosyl-hydrolase, partial [Candidatus Sumerlaeia bacterium]
MKAFTYTGKKLHQINFPLGGIGTGCVGLAGDGRLLDWEIFNKPNKDSFNGFSHFAIRVEEGDKVIDARVLNGDLQAPYTGAPHKGIYSGKGFGPQRATLAGLPHFRETVFTGKFPFAEIAFKERNFPGQVRLKAFNPFIPLNAQDSGIPAAFFEFEVKNTTRKTLTYTIAGNLCNPLPPNQVHKISRRKDATCIELGTNGLPEDSTRYGQLSLATDCPDTSHQQYWFRGRWFDSLEVYWRDLNTPGPFKNRKYAIPAQCCAEAGQSGGDQNHALLAAHVRLKPGQSAPVRFVISWYFPNCENYWSHDVEEQAKKEGIPLTWKNYYATIWKSANDSAAYAMRHWSRLEEETRRFQESIFASTLPEAAIDAISANISILKTPTVLRLEDGTFYGFEGCHAEAGCCPGTCTHVWNYAQALPFLFPELERSVRVADYTYNQLPNGGMPFRIQLPLGIHQTRGRSCADGLFGNVLTVYRDWKICGDTEWLRGLWTSIRKSIEYAWHPDNEDRWDPEKTGVLWGRQHHTLDMEMFGPSSWLCGFYLGALKAAAEMGEALEDHEAAEEYRAVFQKGKAWMDEHLFNGEYYCQQVDIKNKKIPESYGALDAYWDAEHGEIKYQIDEGCSIDQVLPQYHANLYGLGEIYDPAKTKKALRAIYRHNFVKSMREVYNPCRLFALNDEAGLVICSWPEGRRKPAIPIVYAQETMHGFEYAAAVQMIQNGMEKQGRAIVEAVRERYDGERRNPWNEFECGSNYARSMASYALLNAYSGFEFDMRDGGMIGFDPAVGADDDFRCFWCLEGAWGEVEISAKKMTIKVLSGKIALREIHTPKSMAGKIQTIRIAGKKKPFHQNGRSLTFPSLLK